MMSALEKRAWLGLWSMGLPYLVYFLVLIGFGLHFDTLLERMALLAAAACTHAVAYGIGMFLIKRGERGESLLEDERDRAIDARANRLGYYMALGSLIFVGMMLPFVKQGWDLVNAALMMILLTEILRDSLLLGGYRRTRLAY